MIERKVLAHLLAEHLPRQRWFGAHAVGELTITSVEALRPDWPVLLQVLVEHDGTTWQVLLGLRPAEEAAGVVDGRPEAVLGTVHAEGREVLAYDATVDPELALCILERTAPDVHAERARQLGADQSNTSIVYDERTILKVFRRLEDGPNPDVEVTRELARAGFTHVARPLGEWRRGSSHVAVAAEFLTGGTDGFVLALTSLRDLYDARIEPHRAGGDFAPDAERLGRITGEMHLALAEAFGTEPASASAWADDMTAQLARVEGLDAAAVNRIYEQLRAVDPGPAVRVHGDYHLGQVMRTDAGWYVLDFEGEPARPVDERRRPSSVLRDVAGMLRSFHYAPAVAIREYGVDADAETEILGRAWEARNVEAFLRGYEGTDGIEAVLPPDGEARRLVLAAFTLDKAVYEVAYESAHRPEWVSIPTAAVERILEEIG
jgi:maltokinase